MGTGKSTVGPIVAEMFSRPFYDLDKFISQKERKSISEIFTESGEEYFRKLESEIIAELSLLENVVIAVGGGALISEANRRVISQRGVIFCLAAQPETIVKRLDGCDDRPLLNSSYKLERVNELLKLRKAAYDKSSYMIDTSRLTPLEVATEIKRLFLRDEAV